MATLIILEDDHTLLDLYRDVLERADYAVVTASALQEVQAYFEKQSADLIIADLRLGATTAEETIYALQKIRDKYQLPVLLISAQMMIYEDQCRAAGFEYLLTKPFPNSVIIQMVQKILEHAQDN